MTEPTNEEMAEDIGAIEEALYGRADKASLEGLVKRPETRSKDLIDGPG